MVLIALLDVMREKPTPPKPEAQKSITTSLEFPHLIFQVSKLRRARDSTLIDEAVEQDAKTGSALNCLIVQPLFGFHRTAGAHSILNQTSRTGDRYRAGLEWASHEV